MDATYSKFGAPAPTLRRFADLDGPDFYPTPAWATKALLEVEKFEGEIWEPACGDGAMAEVFKETGYRVASSDLYGRGYGQWQEDFTVSERKADNIVTNPPFHSAQTFAEVSWRLARRKSALLLRLAFLEGSARAKTIFKHTPPSRVWVFSERITFYPKGAVRKGSGTTAYAWFIWDKEAPTRTELRWIPPGLKRRYA